MIETQSTLKLKEPQSQDKAHIRKASRGSALLYSLRGVHVAHKPLAAFWKRMDLFCCISWKTRQSQVNILLLKLSSSHHS